MSSKLRSERRFRCLALCLILASSLYGASQTADLSGTIRDSSGAVIPKATITITKENTGLKQETLSEEQGFYRFAFLLPGSYTLTATAQGFGLVSQPSVKLDAGQKA